MSRPYRDEEGSAVIEFTWLAILLLVPLVYIMVAVFQVQSAAFGSSSASRAAGRAFSIAPTEVQGERDALAAARVALADQRIEPGSFTVEITCSTGRGHCHEPGAVITVMVRTQVELPLAPDVFGIGAPSFRLESSHSVPYGQYRVAR